jgi:hypothetical protein
MKNFMAVAFFASAVVTGFSAAQAMPSDTPGHAGRRMLKER